MIICYMFFNALISFFTVTLFSIFVLMVVYKSISVSGVSIVTIKEYLTLELYLFKLVLVFHQPVIGYIII